MLLLLALELTASAHYPHAVFEWVSTSPEGRLATSLNRITAITLSLSTDALEWDTRFLGPGLYQYPTGAWTTEDRILAGSTEAGLWRTEDRGDTWTQVDALGADSSIGDIAVDPARVEAGVLLTAQATDGALSIWRSTDAGVEWEPVHALAADDVWVDLALSPDWATDGRACALLARSGPVCTADGGETWSPRGLPTGAGAGAAVALEAGGGLLVAGSSGLLRSTEGAAGWTEIATPATSALDQLRVLADGSWLLGDYTDLWRSTDGGATWLDATDGLEPRRDGTGAPEDGRHLKGLHLAADGVVYLATWEGVYRARPGERWTPMHALPATQVRTISAAPRSLGGAWVVLGTEGGGAILTDTERSVAWPMGVTGPDGPDLNLHIRDNVLPPDFEQAGVTAQAVQWGVFTSETWGQEWTLRGGSTSPTHMALGRDGDDDWVLVAGGNKEGRKLQYLVDLEQDLQPALENPPCEGEGAVVGQIPPWPGGGDALVAACPLLGIVYGSSDGGATWTGIGQLDPTAVLTLVRLPDGSATWLATTEGLQRLPADADEAEVIAFPGEQVQWFTLSPEFHADGTAFALLARGAWYRTRDHGSSWQELDTPTRQLPWQVALPADFASTGIVVVGAMDGPWLSRDGGESWEWLGMLDRFEEFASTTQVRFTPDEDWAQEELVGASGGYVRRSATVGSRVESEFEGVGVQLLVATGRDGGELELRLDDEAPVRISTKGETRGAVVAWERRDLAPGWHDLELEVISGEIAFDALYGWEQLPVGAGPLPWEVQDDTGDGGATDGGGDAPDGGATDGGGDDTGGEPPDEGGCGCAHGRPDPTDLLALAFGMGLVLRRRKAAAQDGSSRALRHA